MTRVAAAVAAASLALVPSAHAAATKHVFTPKRAAGHVALAEAKQLQRGKGVETGRELTPVLARLYVNLPALDSTERREALALLARPDDGRPDPDGTHKWSPADVRGTPYETTHFKVHFVTSGPDASTASHAKEIGDVLENEVYPCENGAAANACLGGPGLGWRDPAPDAGIGGDDRVDVYIQDLYTNARVFGYVATDPGQDDNPSVPHHAYMVMDKDYTRFGDGSAASGLAAEQVTAAHEYNHVLQNAYDYLEDTWMFEATATYMEDKVYPGNNDYVNYVDDWVHNTRQPLTTFTTSNLKVYGSAVWNHWLDHQYGASAVRAAWEQSVAAENFAPSAYGVAVGAAGGGTFSDEFDRFAAALPEWNVPGIGFPDRYPDVARDGILPVESQLSPFTLPHTTFTLLDVPIPVNSPATIRLLATLPQGTAGAVALVGRSGSDPVGGTVTRSLTPMPSGGTAGVLLDNPSQFSRITAVVVNSDPSRGGFDPVADDYVFTKDASGVMASLAAPGAAIPVTGAAAVVSDHGAFVNAAVDPHLNETDWQIEYGRSVSYESRTAVQKLPPSTLGAAAVTSDLRGLRAKTTYHYRVLATNVAGVTAGSDLTFTTARDVTRPTVRLTVKKQRQATVRRRGLSYRIRCDERCSGSVELVLSRSAARRLGVPTVIARGRVSLDPTSKAVGRLVRLSSRSRPRISAAKRSISVRLVVNVADGSQNHRIATKRTILRR